MRVFVFAYRDCYGPVGGGGGVNYKLYLANKKMGFPVEMIHVFKDMDVVRGMNEYENKSKELDQKKEDSAIRKFLKDIFGGFGPILIMNNKKRFGAAEGWLRQCNKKYHFTNEDVYFMHDIESMYAFSNVFDFDKTIFVYHQQGSLYDEWSGFTGKESHVYREFLEKCFDMAVKEAKVVAFPSHGARECLISSNTAAKNILENLDYKVLYNGYDKPTNLKISGNLDVAIKWLDEFDGFKFTTVSNLNQAKGVERIPKLLSKLKQKGGKFRWVIVGNGVKAQELESKIVGYGLKDDIYWMRDSVPHDDILNLFEHSQFYILLHRRSIFDFATIEAMSYGNIPILSKIGGNNEVIENNSGLLMDDVDDIEVLWNYINNIDVVRGKEQNIVLQKDKFSEKAFFEGYKTVINEIIE